MRTLVRAAAVLLGPLLLLSVWLAAQLLWLAVASAHAARAARPVIADGVRTGVRTGVPAAGRLLSHGVLATARAAGWAIRSRGLRAMGRALRRAGPARRTPTAAQLGAAAVGLLAGCALFSIYLHVSWTVPADSDGASNVLQAAELLHGNPLLRGWRLSDVSFYTTELPQYALLEAARVSGAQVVHVAAAMTYTLLILLAALLARGRRTGREGAIAALIAAGIMLAPQAGSGVSVLLLDPDHVGTAVPVLLTWVIIDRARHRWYAPVAAAILLTAAQVADRVVLFSAIIPLGLACAARAYLSLVRHRRPPRACWLDLSLVAAAGAAAIGALLADQLISASGGFTVAPLGVSLTGFSQVPQQLMLTVQGLLLLFGANFFGHSLGLVSILAMLHLTGLILAAWAVRLAIRQLLRGSDPARWRPFALHRPPAPRRRSPPGSRPGGRHPAAALTAEASAALEPAPAGVALAVRRATAVRGIAVTPAGPAVLHDLPAGRPVPPPRRPAPAETIAPAAGGRGGLIPIVLTAAILVSLASYLFGPRAVDLATTREFAAVLPFSAALAGRLLAGRVDRARMIPALALVLTGYLGSLARVATLPPAPTRGEQLAGFLAAHRLTYGLAGYWQASSTTVVSHGRVTVRPVVATGHSVRAGVWEAKASWYDPGQHAATFVVLYPQRPGRRPYPWIIDVRATFGAPARTYTYGGCTILVWDKNLLADLATPGRGGSRADALAHGSALNFSG